MGRVAASLDTTPTVRPAEPGDAADVATLLETLGYPCTPDEARERIATIHADRRHELLLALVDDAVCGLIALSLVYSLGRGADVARITALVVAPNCQRQGIGRRLLREIESRARRAGACRMEVTSNPRRVDAHAFYHGCGYADGSRHFIKLLGD
ncbi:GNAT family N-acetyltransferase [Lysobacter koreensis]|uniref:GNAT family N-acetyltransferase n=1 Tax=Lysobacter koreensis TaxID=266122 RepID=A0ABW2YLG2_9GAMM